MDKREATRILKEQADYWRWVAKHNGVDGYPDHSLHTIIAGLDWAHDHMANQPETAPDTQTGLMPCGWCVPERIGWFRWNRAMGWREGNEN